MSNTKKIRRPNVKDGVEIFPKVTSSKLPLVKALIKHLNEFERNGESYEMKLNNEEIFLINEFVEGWKI